MTAIDQITGERYKQERIHSPENDDRFECQELVDAAQAYMEVGAAMGTNSPYGPGEVPSSYPWPMKTFKPEPTPAANYVKAAALLAAEVDRLTRLARKGEQG